MNPNMRLKRLDLRRALWAIAIAGLASSCGNGPDVKGPFSGQIVEAETGKPIGGAVVVVVWSYLMNMFEGGRHAVDAREAVTDARGLWQIPARPTRVWEGGIGGVTRRFYVFAPGYEVADPSGTPRDDLAGRENTVTTMRRLTSRGERCANVMFAPISVPDNAVKLRRYLEAIEAERQDQAC